MRAFILKVLKNNHKSIIKFMIVGALTFMLNMVLVWFFYGYLKANYGVAISAAFLLTVMVHFILNRYFTFQKLQPSIFYQGLRYLILLGCNYIITMAISGLVVGFFQLSPYVSVALSTAIISISNFLLMKNFVFPYFRVRQ